MAMFGIGYGLSKMGEGLSSGLLQGKLTQMQLEMTRRKEEQTSRIAQTKEAGLERRHGETIQSREKIATANREVDILSKGMNLGIESFKATKDPKFATGIFKTVTGKDLPIQWPEKETDDFIRVEGGDAIYLIPKDGKIIKDIAEKVPLDNKLESFQEALKDKGILVLPKGAAPMTEAEKLKFGKGGLEEQKIQQGKKTELDKYIEKYNSLSANDPNKQFYLGAIKKKAESTGFIIEVDKEGNVKVTQGPITSETLTTMAKSKIQTGMISGSDALQRLDSIERMFKPEFQQLETRWSAMWSAGKEKLGYDLTPQEIERLEEYSEYRRRAINNLNLYIKEITGAQMSEKEADRLTKGMPDPGTGLIDGDSPTQFKAKLRGIVSEIRAALARYSYIMKHGLKVEDISLGSIPDLINKRGKEIENEMRGKVDDEQLDVVVKRKLLEEFGLAATETEIKEKTVPPTPKRVKPSVIGTDELPPASEHKGKRMYDTTKKIWLKSDGINWVEEK